jgi:hypothetical protein
MKLYGYPLFNIFMIGKREKCVFWIFVRQSEERMGREERARHSGKEVATRQVVLVAWIPQNLR